jgi:hypothetical protein
MFPWNISNATTRLHSVINEKTTVLVDFSKFQCSSSNMSSGF